MDQTTARIKLALFHKEFRNHLQAIQLRANFLTLMLFLRVKFILYLLSVVIYPLATARYYSSNGV